jgi:S1-C subfamily serine protease
MTNPLTVYGEKAGTALRGRKGRVTVLGCAAAALCVAMLGSPNGNPLHADRAFAQDAMRAPASFADVADKVRPAVVSIFTKGSMPEVLVDPAVVPQVLPEGAISAFPSFRLNIPSTTSSNSFAATPRTARRCLAPSALRGPVS